jgi:transposase
MTQPDRKRSSTSSKISAPDELQLNLFGAAPMGKTSVTKTAAQSGRRFISGDPGKIFIGPVRLEEYLKEASQKAPFVVAELLDGEDWKPFEERYSAVGRAPYSPRAMLGLILFGIMHGHHSLRELERFSRLDLGCMWVTGGIAPDHANIGRFIVMHEGLLTQVFESLTRRILKKTGAGSHRLAGDGTVIEAACSHYKLLREEALKERAESARRKLAESPDDPDAQRNAELSDECLKTYKEREQACKRSSRSTTTLRVSPTEPEAPVQRLKRGRGSAASYKPSILANESRIITAMAVDASSETKVIGAMLDQSGRVVGEQPKELLLDGGYFDDGVIAATLERDISMLCSDGQDPEEIKTGKGGVYAKSSFEYDASTDTYRCPAGQTLGLIKIYPGTDKTREFRLYTTRACENCAKRAQCTKTKRREIRRHAEDEQRDALRAVMRQPKARAIFSKRQAMVEPVFGYLRAQQGLNRFRRRGMAGVTREFGLHVLAYNLARAVALLKCLCVDPSAFQRLLLSLRRQFAKRATRTFDFLLPAELDAGIKLRSATI